MLRLLRVDDRLIHGQVAFSWLNATGANRIVVANDKYATNSMLKMSLTLAKPAGVDLKILEKKKAAEELNGKSNEKTMLIVQNVEDALEMCRLMTDVHDVCIGGVREEPGKVLVHRQVYLSEKEIEMIEEMMKMGKNVFAQDVPISKKLEGEEIINKYRR